MSRSSRLRRTRGSGLVILAVVSLVVAACGSDSEPAASTIPAPSVSTTALPPVTTAAPAATVTPTAASVVPTSTTTPAATTFTVASHGSGAITPLEGAGGMLGSGCTPGGDVLADGIWLGYVVTATATELALDLTCLHPGSPPMLTNDLRRTRDVPVQAQTTVFQTAQTTTSYSDWNPEATPVWIYINDGMATEIAYPTANYVVDQGWLTSEAAMPVTGGCCADNYRGPVSPTAPWPRTGLPADGVYWVSAVPDEAAGDYIVEIRRFVSCDTEPDLCAPDFRVGDMGIGSDAIFRRITPGPGLTVKIIGIELEPSLGPTSIEGLGADFAALTNEMRSAWHQWIGTPLAAGEDPGDIYADLIERGSADPSFPYGPAPGYGLEAWQPLAYRGPLGVQILEHTMEELPLLDWVTQMEIKDGYPVFYAWVGNIVQG